MIEIHPLRDIEKLKTLYKKSNVQMSDCSMAIVASDNDEVLGYCLFDMRDNDVMIFSIEPTDDVNFADGLLRSALHVGVENGRMTAFYSENAPKKLFSTLCFIKNAEKRELNVNKLFSSCQNC